MDDEGIPSTALREIAILKKMRHPNVVNVIDIAFNNTNIVKLSSTTKKGTNSLQFLKRLCTFALK